MESLSQNKYITFGKEFESKHSHISLFKKILFLLLSFSIFIQAVTFLIANRYTFIPKFNIDVAFYIIGAVIALLLIGSIVYAIYFSVKNFLILLFFISILVLAFLFILIFTTPIFEGNESRGTLIFSYVINILIALAVHIGSLYIVNKILRVRKFSEKEQDIKDEKKGWEKYLFFLLSPDYFFAGYYKGFLKSKIYNIDQCDPSKEFKRPNGEYLGELKEQKNRIRYFIVFSNWINVSLIVLFVTFLLFVNINDIVSYWWYDFILYLIVFRLISRCFEVSYAFYKDVVRNKVIYLYNYSRDKGNRDKFISNWRNSAIRKPERISLAIHSYIEILLLFAAFYFFILGSTYNNPCELSNFKSQTVNEVCLQEPLKIEEIVEEQINLIEMLLYSSSVTFFNVSFDYTDSTPFAWKIAHVSQVLVSIILIVLCLASYISFKDDMDEEEIKDYLLIKYYDKKEKEGYKKVYNKIEEEGIDRKID